MLGLPIWPESLGEVYVAGDEKSPDMVAVRERESKVNTFIANYKTDTTKYNTLFSRPADISRNSKINEAYFKALMEGEEELSDEQLDPKRYFENCCI